MGKKISVLIPAYNEKDNIREICQAVEEQLILLREYDYEIVVIDNKSEDGTRELLREICAENPHVKAIFNLKNFGQFNSPFYGMLQCTGDCVIPMCADFQDPPDLIPQMVQKWAEGNKVVCMVKSGTNEGTLITWAREEYYKLIRKMSDVEQIRQFIGFGLYDRSFMDIMKTIRDPIPFFRGLVAEYAPEHAEIPYTQPPRKAGKTHNNFYSLYDAAMLSFTSYTKAGLRIATFTGFIIAFLSFLFGLAYLILKLLFWNSFTAGYAPMMITVFFMGGLLLAFLGFLGEYVMAINVRVMNRPLVVEEERINFTDQS